MPKLSELTEDTSPTIDDEVVLTNDPSGTPATRRSALTYINNLFNTTNNNFAGQYASPTALIAASDSYSEGDLVRAERYLYEVAASAATDHDITNAGGVKFYCLANPYVTPDQFGAPGRTNDETSYVQAAIDSGKPVFLNRFYDVTSVDFPANINGIVIHGAGARISGLVGTNAATECILQTFTTGNTADSQSHHLSNFSIQGSGKRGLGICQIINSTIDNIYVGGPTKQAILMEMSFGNVLRNIETGYGARVDMQIGATVLDTIVDLFYTNNADCQHHINIEGDQQELAAQTAAGHGIITFNMPTLQGADGYAIRISNTYRVNFTNTYFEANNGSVLVEDADLVHFEGCSIGGNSSSHLVWLGQSRGSATYSVSFAGCDLPEPMVVDNGLREVQILGCYGAGFDVQNILASTSTYSLTGVAVDLGNNSGSTKINGTPRELANHTSALTLQATDASSFVDITVTAAGTISAGTAFSLAAVDHGPHEPVVTYPGSSSLSWTNGVAITPIQYRCVGGTTAYTYSIEADDIKNWSSGLPTGVSLNSSTGQLTGTPTETGTFRWKVRVTDANGMVGRSRGCSATVS